MLSRNPNLELGCGDGVLKIVFVTLLSRSLVLLKGGNLTFLIGFSKSAPDKIYHKIQPFFVVLQAGALKKPTLKEVDTSGNRADQHDI